MFHTFYSTRPGRGHLSRGFSLIELAVVVAIIGILAAIAIPTFLGQRAGAQDRQAHSALRNVMTIAKAAAANADDGNYPTVGEIDLAEPQYTISAGASDDANTISAVVIDDRTLVLSALSASGTCWVVVTPLDDVTTYGEFVADGDCEAAGIDPEDVTGPSFGDAVDMSAPEGEEPEDPFLAVDDFDGYVNGAGIDGQPTPVGGFSWNEEGPAAEVIDGRLTRATGSNNTPRSWIDLGQDDSYAVEVDIALEAGAQWAGVVVRLDPTNPNTYWTIRLEDDGRLAAWRYDNGDPTNMGGQLGVTPGLGEYTLRVEVDGDTFTVIVDGNPVNTYSTDTYEGLGYSGVGVAYRVADGDWIDAFRVMPLD